MAQGKKTIWTKAQINKIKKYALLQCRTRTIAEILGVPEATIRDNFAQMIAKKKAEGRLKLRTAQWEDAIEGNNTVMRIFLGKNILGQADKQELTGKDGGPLEIVHFDKMKDKPEGAKDGIDRTG